MFERFTVQAGEVVRRACNETAALRDSHVGTHHLLLSLLHEDAGIAYTVLHEAGIDQQRVRADIERLTRSRSIALSDEDAAALKTIGIDLDAVLSRIAESFGPVAPVPESRRGWWAQWRDGSRFGPRAKKVLELALREAVRLRHNDIGAEHILLGIIREGEGLAAKILIDAGLTLDGLRRQVLAALDKAA